MRVYPFQVCANQVLLRSATDYWLPPNNIRSLLLLIHQAVHVSIVIDVVLQTACYPDNRLVELRVRLARYALAMTGSRVENLLINVLAAGLLVVFKEDVISNEISLIAGSRGLAHGHCLPDALGRS